MANTNDPRPDDAPQHIGGPLDGEARKPATFTAFGVDFCVDDRIHPEHVHVYDGKLRHFDVLHLSPPE